jgi:hypothetical protein
MSEFPLLVFSTLEIIPPLIGLRDILQTKGYAASFGVDILGEAEEEQLKRPDWEAAFLRWNEPQIHEVALIERFVRGEDEEAEALISQYTGHIAQNPDSAGRLIIAAHLNNSRVVYAVQLLPALFTEDDHPAWSALDVILRYLATHTDGIIYAEAEGFCDPDGELLLAEEDESTSEPRF